MHCRNAPISMKFVSSFRSMSLVTDKIQTVVLNQLQRLLHSVKLATFPMLTTSLQNIMSVIVRQLPPHCITPTHVQKVHLSHRLYCNCNNPTYRFSAYRDRLRFLCVASTLAFDLGSGPCLLHRSTVDLCSAGCVHCHIYGKDGMELKKILKKQFIIE